MNLDSPDGFRFDVRGVRRSRRSKRWIVVSTAVISLMLLSTGVVVFENTRGTVMTGKQSLTDLQKKMQLIVAQVGGKWVYEDEITPWVPGELPIFSPLSCGSSFSKSFHYKFGLFGPGSPNPEAASAKIAKQWVESGYVVHTDYRNGPELENGIQISVDLPQNSWLVYFVNTRLSTVEGAGICLAASQFPDMKLTFG